MKNQALTLLQIAVQLFPPLAKLVGDALAAFSPSSPEEQVLVEQVRGILPAHTSLHDLVRDLEGKQQK